MSSGSTTHVYTGPVEEDGGKKGGREKGQRGVPVT